MRGASAGNLAEVGLWTNDGDGVEFCVLEGQGCVAVLQEDSTLFGDAAGGIEAAFDVNHTFLCREIDEASGEFGAEDAPDVIVDFGKRNFAGQHGFL